MNSRVLNILALTTGLQCLAATAAVAQSGLTSGSGLSELGSEGMMSSSPNLSARASQGGVRLSESGMLHVGIATETGYDTNVFYNNDDKAQAPMLRVTPFINLTN